MIETHCRRKEKERMRYDGMRNCEELMDIYKDEFVKDGAYSVTDH
jgi:hypothetical protein